MRNFILEPIIKCNSFHLVLIFLFDLNPGVLLKEHLFFVGDETWL